MESKASESHAASPGTRGGGGASKAVESATLENHAASSGTRGGGGAPSGWASQWEYRAAQSHQARPKEAQGASWGALAKGHERQGGQFECTLGASWGARGHHRQGGGHFECTLDHAVVLDAQREELEERVDLQEGRAASHYRYVTVTLPLRCRYDLQEGRAVERGRVPVPRHGVLGLEPVDGVDHVAVLVDVLPVEEDLEGRTHLNRLQRRRFHRL